MAGTGGGVKRSVVLVGGLSIVLLAVVAAATLGVGPLGTDREMPTPEITSFEVVDRGCQEDVRRGSTSRHGAGSATYAGVIDDISPEAALSAEVRRTSPERADVTTYSLHIRTHEPETTTDSCPGSVAYRVTYDAPYPDGSSGLRSMRFVDGELESCGGSSSGPDLGCVELMDETETHWAGGSEAEL